MNTTTTEARTILWPGQSGNKYNYSIYEIGTNFNDVAGNYVYAEETKPNSWSPKYFGQTNNLKNRLSNHEKETCATRNGATHIHVHANSSETSRLSEEKDLIVNWKPPCNEQLI
jgi:predicted GIY-YIG superfamily endonuclease